LNKLAYKELPIHSIWIKSMQIRASYSGLSGNYVKDPHGKIIFGLYFCVATQFQFGLGFPNWFFCK